MAKTKKQVNVDAEKAHQACLAYVKSRVSWRWLGLKKALPSELHNGVALYLEADEDFVHNMTDLYDWKIPSLAAISQFKSQVNAWWNGLARIKWPFDKGRRLLKKSDVPMFEEMLKAHLASLQTLANQVQQDRDAIIKAASKRGKAFDQRDYPIDLSAQFRLTWDIELLDVPQELRELSEDAYKAQVARRQTQIIGAIQIAEQGQLSRLLEMVTSLASRLLPNEKDDRKIITASSLERIKEFCTEFASVVCWGCDDMEEIVSEVSDVIVGVDIEDIRASSNLKRMVGKSLSELSERIQGLLPKRIEE